MQPPPPSPRPMPAALRIALLAAGWILVALGALGAVLPILPTTPFLLLAAWCFARASERVHRWLLASPVFGPYLRQWREQRTVPRDAKVKAVLLVVATLGSSIVFFVESDWLRLALAFLGIGLVIFLLRLPSERPGELALDDRQSD